MALVDYADWVPTEAGDEVLERVVQASAVEQVARREPMAHDAKEVPVAGGFVMAVGGKGSVLAEDDSAAAVALLRARKIRSGIRLAEEDIQDSMANIIDAKSADWANSYAKFLDNAALGTTGAENGTTVPFTSVYAAATAAGNVTQTAGAVTYDQLSAVLAAYEAGDYFDTGSTVIVAHPAFLSAFRGVKDSQGMPVFVQGINGTPETLFGRQVAWTTGARTSATATQNPTGNPILVVGNRDYLILGDRSDPEFRVDYQEITDEHVLQGRARKGFVVADANAVAVLEITSV